MNRTFLMLLGLAVAGNDLPCADVGRQIGPAALVAVRVSARRLVAVDRGGGIRHGRDGARSTSGHPSGRDRAATAACHLSAVWEAPVRCDLRCRNRDDQRAVAGSRVVSDMGVGNGFDRGDGDGRNYHRRDLTRENGADEPRRQLCNRF